MWSKTALGLSLLFLITAIASCNRQPPSFSTSSANSSAVLLTDPDSQQLDLSQAEIGQIPIHTTEAEVIRLLGAPTQTNDQRTECCGILRSLVYSHLTVELTEGDTGFQVYGVSTRSEAVATRGGVKVGDRRQTLINIHGQPTRTSSEADITFLIYELGDAATFMTFAIQGDRIVEMSYSSLLN